MQQMTLLNIFIYIFIFTQEMSLDISSGSTPFTILSSQKYAYIILTPLNPTFKK